LGTSASGTSLNESAADTISKQGPDTTGASPSFDFEFGRYVERVENKGTLDPTELYNLLQVARARQPLQPPPSGPLVVNNVASRMTPPPPTDLPLPTDFGAGARFERHDSNHDGFITRAEFNALVEEWRSSDPEELRRLTGLSNLVHAAALFNQYDTNNDGHLSRGDFLQLVRSESKRQGPDLSTSYTRQTKATNLPLAPVTDLPAKYSWFDETIGVPVSATGAESARSAGHAVTTLKEAYQARLAKLQEQLAVMLLPKRERLIQMASSIRSRIDEVQSARLAVERETVMDCEAILERLRSSESVKLATLNQSSTEVDAEVEAIDRLTQHIDGVRFGYFVNGGVGDGIGRHETPAGMLSLIQNYPDFVRSLERSASRALPREPITDEEEVAALTDFPREVKKRTDALAREERYEEALEVKDRMLWEVIQGHKDLEEKLEKEKALCKEYSDEMGSWLELTDRLSREVNQLREFAAEARALESDHGELIRQRQADQVVLQQLRSQNKNYNQIIEENVALRQQLAATQRELKQQNTITDPVSTSETKDDSGNR